MNLKQYFQFFIKELNKNKLRIAKVFFTIFVSLLIFSSVIILKNNIEKEINNNSKLLLGGDLELSQKNKPLSTEFVEKLKKSFQLTEVLEFTSIISSQNGETKTTRIKVVDNFYPLIGELKVVPENSFELLKKKSDAILIDNNIKNNLGIEIGEKIKMQNISFEVVGFISSLPDIGGFFLFGDQALINKASLRSLKIDHLGNFTNFKYKMIKKKEDQKILDEINKNKIFNVRYPSDVGENINNALENFIYFLTIISASAILISGIGLKNSLFSYLCDNQFKIAILKSLGLSSRNIMILFSLQILIILLLCSLLAYLISLLVISFFENSLLNILNININPNFEIQEYLIIPIFSIIIFFIFAKPVLNSIEQIKVSDLFRNSNTNLKLNYNKSSLLKIFTSLMIFIFSFCALNIKPIETGIFFIFFLVIGFFYYFLSKTYILILNKLKPTQNISIKVAIKNLNSHQNLNSIVVMTMGLGMTILFFIGILTSNINKELNGTVSQNTPDYFFLGIQKNELNLFSEQINHIDIAAKKNIVPMISARIEAINGKKPKEIIDEKNKSFWFVNGERRISWSEEPPSNNPIVEGKWWNSENKNSLTISLDATIAKDLKLKLGDSITFNVFGNSVTGIIKNLRKVDYKDLNINFAILFNPNYASQIPHEFMSTVKFKNLDKVSLRNLLSELPAITYIKLSEYINKTKNFLNKLFIVSILISSVVILVGLIVISNAVNVIGNLKVYQNLIFKILGFSNLNLMKLLMYESVILFVPIIFSSIMFSTIFCYFFVTNFFSIDFYFPFKITLIIACIFLFVLIFTILISNRKFLSFNTYSLLKN